MFRLLVVATLISLACGASFKRGLKPMLDGRIVGGEDTTIYEYPHQISFLNFGSHRCGGSIATATKIITAAHCTTGTAAANVQIRHGSTNHAAGGTVIGIAHYINHPQYNIPEELANDMAVMILPTPIAFADHSQPIPLPIQGASLVAGQMGRVSGWGTLTQGGPCCPNVLQVVSVPYVTNAQCGQAYAGWGYTISDDMLCAGFLGVGGADACQGDSGGPLIFDGVLHGVVSWGIGCAQPDYPGVYARVAYFREWIDAQS